MRKILHLVLCLSVAASISGCFRDLGNYEYSPVNDIVISDKGFEKPYDVRRDYEPFSIKPEITFSNDPQGTGYYEYEWVAVGQNLLKGRRFVIGRDPNLYCEKIQLEAEEYILYLKVKDLSTDIVFSKSVPLTVKAATTEGWLLAGEVDGRGQIDMISFSGDTLVFRDLLSPQGGLELSPLQLVWINNDDYAYDDRIFTGSDTGSYRFDRETFQGSETSSLKSSFIFPPESGDCVLTACYDIDYKRHIVIIDGKGYEMKHGMIGNTFCTYDQVAEFDIAGQFIYNQSFEPGHGRLACVFYNTDSKEFCLMSHNVSTKLDNQLWSWTTKDVNPEGLEMVAAVNSFFNKGLGLAVMQNPDNSDLYIYEITIPSYGYPSKDHRYKVDKDKAVGFAASPGYIVSTLQGYVIYACDNKLYGYEYDNEPQRVELLHQFAAGETITCLKADYESDYSSRDKDFFYVATYDESSSRSGIVYRFQVTDDPDRMEVGKVDTYDEGFLKIHSMCYKAF